MLNQLAKKKRVFNFELFYYEKDFVQVDLSFHSISLKPSLASKSCLANFQKHD